MVFSPLRKRTYNMNMKFELNFLPSNATDEDIFEHIREVDSLVNKEFLTQKDFDSYSKIHSGTLVRRFGDWGKVLELAGLGDKYTGAGVFGVPRGEISQKQRQQKGRYMTNDEVIDELKRIAKELNKETITFKDVREHSKILAPELVRRRFGTWAKGIEQAGLKLSKMYYQGYSDEECFENLLNVWTHYGRQPVYSEMKLSPSEIGPDTYKRRFGGWRNALEAFVARMNQDDGDEAKHIPKKEQRPRRPVRVQIRAHSVTVGDKRNACLGLRYKVLSRDKFKCVCCGASPATDPTCKLHIDHIIPFSKGGKTVLVNLQTLCEKCNLGKGNRHFE